MMIMTMPTPRGPAFLCITHSIRIVFEEEMMLPSSETPSMRMVQVEPCASFVQKLKVHWPSAFTTRLGFQ